MRKPVIWIIVVVFALGLSIGVYINKSQEVQTSAAVLHDFTTFIEGAGTVDAPKQVVRVPSSGVIAEVPVAEGQRVAAGERVLQMDDEALRLQKEEALLGLNAQKKAWGKQNEKLTEGQKEAAMMAAQTAGYGLEAFNSAAQGQEAPAVGREQVDMARLKVSQAQYLIDHAAVYSALGGTVLDVSVRAGEVAAAGTQAVLIASMDEVEINSVFADLDASSIAPGMEVLLHGGCLGSGTCGGIVTRIMPKAEVQQSQTGAKSAAIVKIKPADSALFNRLGASVELKVITGRKTGIGVPIESLAQDASGLYIYVVRRGRAYRTPVEVGVLDEQFAEIKAGIQAGERVALNPTELRNGMKVSGT